VVGILVELLVELLWGKVFEGGGLWLGFNYLRLGHVREVEVFVKAIRIVDFDQHHVLRVAVAVEGVLLRGPLAEAVVGILVIWLQAFRSNLL